MQEARRGALGAGAEPAPPPGLARQGRGRITAPSSPLHGVTPSRCGRRTRLLWRGAAAFLRGLAAVRLGALGLALAQARRLADAVAQVVQLGPADRAGALHLDLGDLRRVQREDALDAFALDDAADGEHLAHALAAAGDHHAAEDLDALLLAFQDALVDVHLVADLELRGRLF